jgi:PKD repeat protein
VIAWFFAIALATQTVLVPVGSTWTYLDTGVDPIPDWNTVGFDDTAWLSGPSPLGYGEWDLVTTIDEGDPLDRPITNWFRHEFTATGVTAFTALSMELRRDDGAVVYLNGVEMDRTNMPTGTILSSTPAVLAIEGSDEATRIHYAWEATGLVEGTNVLAIEVHNISGLSADLSMDATLSAWDGPGAVVRGPYLQQNNTDGMTLRWQTEGPSDGRAWVGDAPGNLITTLDDLGLSSNHEITLTGLPAQSTWYYGVGSPDEGVLAGDDFDHRFTTNPPVGDAGPTRVWVLGDCGTTSTSQEAVRDAFTVWSAGQDPDMVMLLGDNAYNSGTQAEYQTAIFDMYTDTIRRSPMWSCIGNHDGYAASSLTQVGPYFDIFNFPKGGEVGGVASGTEAYYSFDYANIHFISLDSNGSDRAIDGPMLQWLEQDLAAANADWVIAFWHHPPYSQGSHNSDFETQLVEMRENAVPILEAWGVDLVLGGHSHSYERSYLIDGHHGLSSTYDGTEGKDEGDGDPASEGAYRKLSAGMAGNEGAVFAVAGSSGKVSGGLLSHPAMHLSISMLGSMVLDIDGNTLDAIFLNDLGIETDRFSIEKSVATITELTGPRVGIEAVDMAYTASGFLADGTAITGFTWDYGDGTPTESGSSVSHTWPGEGTWMMTVTADDDSGQPFSRGAWITVDNAPPVLDPLTAPVSCDEGELLAWVGIATDAGNDPITYTWDFGDGTILYGASVAYAMGDDGPHTVTLTASDDVGGEDTESVIFSCNNVAPSLLALSHPPLVVGDDVDITALWTDPGRDDTQTIDWVLEGALPVTGDSISHTFLTTGDYGLNLTLTDDDGGTNVYDLVLSVIDGPPTVDLLTMPQGISEGEAVSLEVLASEPGGMPFTISWDFGDGQGAVGDSVDHTWVNDGWYTLTLTLDDGTDGGRTDVLIDVEVSNEPARIDSVSAGMAIEGEAVALSAVVSDPGTEDLLTVRWLLPDQLPIEGPFATWVPRIDGPQEIWVEVSDEHGVGESQVVAVTIQNAPPFISGLPDSNVAYVNEPWSWEVPVTDPGGDPLTFDLLGPQGAWVDDAGVVRWSPRQELLGEKVELTLLVSDDSGAGVSLSWTLTVEPELDGEHARWRNTRGCNQPGTPMTWWVLLLPVIGLRQRQR